MEDSYVKWAKRVLEQKDGTILLDLERNEFILEWQDGIKQEKVQFLLETVDEEQVLKRAKYWSRIIVGYEHEEDREKVTGEEEELAYAVQVFIQQTLERKKR